MSDDPFFRVKADDTIYELDRLTLGDAHWLEQHFGFEDMTQFNPGRPSHILGLLALCLHKESPDTPLGDIRAQVDDIDIQSFEAEDDTERPTPAAEGAASG